MNILLTTWVKNFEERLRMAKGPGREFIWETAVHIFSQLGVGNARPGACICTEDDWGSMSPLHREHLEFNSQVWTTLQIHGFLGTMRSEVLTDALRSKPKYFSHEYSLELLEHFLLNKPSRDWVDERFVTIFSPTHNVPNLVNA